jgi:hypothetical protein
MPVPPPLSLATECLLDNSYRTKWEDHASYEEIILISRVRSILLRLMVFPIYKKNNLRRKGLSKAFVRTLYLEGK